MDYDSLNPPNLILGGAGLLEPLFGLLATGIMAYAAVGAFVFHAGMTPLSRKWDICSVYTLVCMGIPYLIINHLHCLKRQYPRPFLLFVCICVLMIYILPYEFREVSRSDAVPVAVLHRPVSNNRVSRTSSPSRTCRVSPS